MKDDGSIKQLKTHLVGKGYTPQDIDYKKTFSPVVWFVSSRLILVIFAHLNVEQRQRDVKTTFLNGELEEQTYME